jgi:hypothetical protein
MGCEFCSIVGADVIGNASTDKQVCQSLQNILAGQSSGHVNRQTLSTVLIQNRQHPHRTTIVRPGQYKVIAPDVIPMRRPKPNARTIIQP